MSHRCITSFAYGENVYAQGAQIADSDPILKSHAEFFTRVDEPAKGGETASAAPAEARTVEPSDQPAGEATSGDGADASTPPAEDPAPVVEVVQTPVTSPKPKPGQKQPSK